MCVGGVARMRRQSRPPWRRPERALNLACAGFFGLTPRRRRDGRKEWCRRKESNFRPRPYQGRALPLSYGGTGCAAHHAIGTQSAQPAWAQSGTHGRGLARNFHRKTARSGTPALDAPVPSLHHARCRFCRPGGSIGDGGGQGRTPARGYRRAEARRSQACPPGGGAAGELAAAKATGPVAQRASRAI